MPWAILRHRRTDRLDGAGLQPFGFLWGGRFLGRRRLAPGWIGAAPLVLKGKAEATAMGWRVMLRHRFGEATAVRPRRRSEMRNGIAAVIEAEAAGAGGELGGGFILKFESAHRTAHNMAEGLALAA